MTISLSVLAMCAALMGWQLKTLAEVHRFQRHVEHLVTNLRQLQIVALSHKADIELSIHKEKGKYLYTLTSDEPGVFQKKRQGHLEGIKKMTLGKKPLDSLTLQISRTGVITPHEVLSLFQDASGDKKVQLDLRYSPTIYFDK